MTLTISHAQLFEDDERLRWDKGVKQYVESMPTDHDNVSLVYSLSNCKLIGRPKEFFEKRFLYVDYDGETQ